MRSELFALAALAVFATLTGCDESTASGEAQDETTEVDWEPVLVTEAPPEPPPPEFVVDRTATIAAPFGAVEIRQISKPGASHAEAGRLHVTYFDEQGAVAEEFPEAVLMGSWGGMNEFSIEDRHSELPVIVAKGGGTWQGYTCSWTSFTELQPGGPVELLTIQTFYSNEGTGNDPERVEGEIIEPTSTGVLTVRYTGTENFTATYRRKGNAYSLADGEELSGC